MHLKQNTDQTSLVRNDQKCADQIKTHTNIKNCDAPTVVAGRPARCVRVSSFVCLDSPPGPLFPCLCASVL